VAVTEPVYSSEVVDTVLLATELNLISTSKRNIMDMVEVIAGMYDTTGVMFIVGSEYFGEVVNDNR
jgi:hypothetical protein